MVRCGERDKEKRSVSIAVRARELFSPMRNPGNLREMVYDKVEDKGVI